MKHSKALRCGPAALVCLLGFAWGCGSDFVYFGAGSGAGGNDGVGGSPGLGGASASVTDASSSTVAASSTIATSVTIAASSTGIASSVASTASATAASSTASGGMIDKMLPCGDAGECPLTCCGITAKFQACKQTLDECLNDFYLAGVDCDDASDCPGKICCAFEHQAGGFTKWASECTATCGANKQFQLCRDSKECPNGLTCADVNQPATVPAGYEYCAPQ